MEQIAAALSRQLANVASNLRPEQLHLGRIAHLTEIRALKGPKLSIGPGGGRESEKLCAPESWVERQVSSGRDGMSPVPSRDGPSRALVPWQRGCRSEGEQDGGHRGRESSGQG